jgi:hypothetical protein
MPEDWSLAEVEAIVSDYFEMLEMELRGRPFNKAEHNRNLQKLLNNRTRGSIERKNQNISAVLIALRFPYIFGYKPLGNRQQLLYDIVAERLPRTLSLTQAAAAAVAKPIEQDPQIKDVLRILVDPPQSKKEEFNLYENAKRINKFVKKDYLEIESRNQSLGFAGEKLILEYEHQRLWEAGKRDLANRIEHVAESHGDNLGFDILSFETNGRERPIEVKTTRFGELTPFFASKNEVEVSEARESEYHLYRLFKFDKEPKLFILPGSLRKTCRLDPVQFSALPI